MSRHSHLAAAITADMEIVVEDWHESQCTNLVLTCFGNRCNDASLLCLTHTDPFELVAIRTLLL